MEESFAKSPEGGLFYTTLPKIDTLHKTRRNTNENNRYYIFNLIHSLCNLKEKYSIG
jgi:hypothetical protein